MTMLNTDAEVIGLQITSETAILLQQVLPMSVNFLSVVEQDDWLSSFEKFKAVLLITECNEPDDSAINLLTMMKAHAGFSSVSVLMLTHNKNGMVSELAYQRGVVDIIEFPITNAHLVNRIMTHYKKVQVLEQMRQYNQILEQKLVHRTREMELTFQNMVIKNNELIDLTHHLEHQKKQYEQVIGGANIGTFELNLKTHEAVRNNVAALLIGALPAQVNQPGFWEQRIHAADIHQYNYVLAEISDGKRNTFRHEFRVQHTQGNWIWLSMRGKVTGFTPEGSPLIINGIYIDITERKNSTLALLRSESTLKRLIQCSRNTFGESFYNALTLLFAETVGADYAFVGRLTLQHSIKTLAFCKHNALLNNIEYNLLGSPCEQVLTQPVCVYFNQVNKLYPNDVFLVENNIEGYFGISIKSRSGQPLGVLVALFNQPITDLEFISSIISLFESQFGSEMERHQAELALKKSEELLLKAQNLGKVGHWVMDYQANRMTWSDETFRIFEVLPHEFDHSSSFVYQFVPESLAPDISQKYQQAIAQKTEYHNSHPIKVKGDKIKYINERAFFEFDANGNLRYALGITQDITEQTQNKLELIKYQEHLEEIVAERTALLNQANQELAERNHELETTNQTVQQQNIALENTIKALKEAQAKVVEYEKMASLGVMLAGVAHELNNPINFIANGIEGVKANSKLLINVMGNLRGHQPATNNSDEEYYSKVAGMLNKSIQGVEMGIERTISIIKSLNSFSRSDENKTLIRNLHELIDTTLVILFHQYKNRIEIKKHYDNLPPFMGYPGMLNQLFMNIIANAVQAIDHDGVITITTRFEVPQQLITITIADTGAGIADEIASKIFDPFFSTKPVGKGVGLGLYIAYNVVKEHNGHIQLNKTSTKGTEFMVTIPVSLK